MAYVIDFLELFGIFVMLTISLNYLVGNVGIMYVGHIAFFAIGAYSTAVMVQNFNIFPPVAMMSGIIFSVSLSAMLGIVTIRLKGHYLLLASLGMCEIVRSIVNNSQFTGAAEGILVPYYFISQSISGRIELSILIIIFLLIEILFFVLLDRSPKGRLFRAVRDDPMLLLNFGKSVNKLKLEALVISSIWASIAGSLYAHYSRYIDPTSFTVMDSLILLIAIMIGGIASFWGSFIAGFFLIILPAIIRFIDLPASVIGPIHRMLFAFILLLTLRYKPKGLTGKVLLK